jgi:NADPH:quinone reductase-like Zn-dependent oxidoreductase
MSTAVVVESYGGPEVLQVRDVPEPHAGPGQVRIRVTAAGLNPVDWKVASSAQAAEAFGVAVPTGFGNDFAGAVDEVGDGVSGFMVGDRVFGGARGRAVADYVVATLGTEVLLPTPDGVADEIAATLPIAGATADAVVSGLGLGPADTVLLGGAAGGVGVLAVQLARLAGARVIGTGSEGSSEFLRKLGAEPVAYGAGLADRVRALGPAVTAAADLYGTEAATAAIELGVPASRVVTIAASAPPAGVRATGGRNATPGALARIASLIAAGELTVPIAASYPITAIRDAVTELRDGHVHGKIVITPAKNADGR